MNRLCRACHVCGFCVLFLFSFGGWFSVGCFSLVFSHVGFLCHILTQVPQSPCSGHQFLSLTCVQSSQLLSIHSSGFSQYLSSLVCHSFCQRLAIFHVCQVGLVNGSIQVLFCQFSQSQVSFCNPAHKALCCFMC